MTKRRPRLPPHRFYEVYAEADPAVTAAAPHALAGIDTQVGVMQAADLGLDALSLASIYFLAAIGLAITFGVMGVINMAHGEFITIGAYTGYVVQLFVPDYTAVDPDRPAAGLCRHLRRGRGDGAAGDPPSLQAPAGDAAGDLRHLHRAAADPEERLRHPGPPADLARLAGRGAGRSTTSSRSATSASRSSCWRCCSCCSSFT